MRSWAYTTSTIPNTRKHSWLLTLSTIPTPRIRSKRLRFRESHGNAFLSPCCGSQRTNHHKRRVNVNGIRPPTWSWTSRIASIDFASAESTSFPTSDILDRVYYFHIIGHTQSLIGEWCLYYQKRNATGKFRFSGRHYYELKPDLSIRYSRVRPHELLALFSHESHGDKGASPSLIIPGVLEFLGPFIPKPTTAESSWTKTPEGEWILRFGSDFFAVVRLDSE